VKTLLAGSSPRANGEITNPYVGVTHAVKTGEDGAVILLNCLLDYTLTVTPLASRP